MKIKASKQRKNQRLIKPEPLVSEIVKSRGLRRVRSYELTVTRDLRVQLKLRSFNTQPKNRSTKFKQHVFKLGLFGVKEVAISYKLKRRRASKLINARFASGAFSNVLIVFGLVGVVFYGVQVSGLTSTNPPQLTVQNVSTEKESEEPYLAEKVEANDYLQESRPVNVSIPSINVDAEIENVGLLSSGAIETPGVLSDRVGWYQHGPSPGELGPSVLVGHVDSYKGPSVFWNLSKLSIGDTISVMREDGVSVEFRITKTVQYDRDNFGTNEVYGNIDYAGLRVITCGGVFNHVTGYYSKNTVIFATAVL